MENSLSTFKMYTVQYSYGMHHLEIEVASYDFFRVIDHLSSEFEISKVFSRWDSDKSSDYECLRTEYYITNYYGNKEKVGEIFERKLKE